MSEYYTAPDEAQGSLFRKAEDEMKAVAEKHGFRIRLVDDCKGTWYFYPEVDAGLKPSDTRTGICEFCGTDDCGTRLFRDNGTGAADRTDRCRMLEAMKRCVELSGERDEALAECERLRREAQSGNEEATLHPMEPGRRAVRVRDLAATIEKLELGETLEVHHPQDEGTPTNMGVVHHTRRDGRVVSLHAGCWGVVDDDTIAWCYTVMDITPPSNSKAGSYAPVTLRKPAPSDS